MAKRSLVVGVLVILSLAFSGIAYAAWTKTIAINGTLTTAKVDIKWVEEGINFVCIPLAPDHVENTVVVEPVWVSGDEVQINIENAFPGFQATFDLKVKNDGGMPVKVRLLSHGVDGVDTPVQVIMGVPTIGEWVALQPSFYLNTNEVQQIQVRVSIPIEVDGHQGESYSFFVKAEATQWNVGIGE